MTVWHINKLVTTISTKVEAKRVIILYSHKNNDNSIVTKQIIVRLDHSDNIDENVISTCIANL